MPEIKLETIIHAPVERCFDLSRSIDLHMKTTESTGEKAIAGVTEGLIGLDQEVTWRARHFGIVQLLKTRISRYHRPFHFRTSQVKGAFRSMEHDHHFEPLGNATLMTDLFVFEAPLGLIGKLFCRLCLTGYMKRFLVIRNNHIRQVAESGEWQQFIPQQS